MKLADFQVIICLGTAIANNVITFSACSFIIYIARITHANMNSDNILTCELANLTRSILLSLYSMQKIMEEYGIMEHLIELGIKRWGWWMGNRIYLECLKASASLFIPRQLQTLFNHTILRYVV